MASSMVQDGYRQRKRAKGESNSEVLVMWRKSVNLQQSEIKRDTGTDYLQKTLGHEAGKETIDLKGENRKVGV